MANGWIDGYEHRYTEDCGAYPDLGAKPKKVWHTTESGWGSIDPIINFFDDGVYNSSHFVVDPGNWRRAQLLPVTRAACALERRGSTHTNGVLSIQTEICGFSATAHTWNDNVLLFLARHAVDARLGVLEAMGKTFAQEVHVTFYGQDAGFTLASYNARQRLQGEEWRAIAGHVGHQHVPGNAHWDPGKLNVARIVELARYIESGATTVPPTTGEEDNLMGITIEQIEAAAKKAAREAVLEVVPAGLLNGSWEKDTRALFGGVAIKKPDDPKQFLIGVNECGPYKLWIRDGEQKDLFIKAGIIRQSLTFVELTEPEEIAWLDSLPEV